MAYTRRPFNPLIPAPNQVVNELNQANENFDILARAFVSDDPTTYKVKNALNSDNAINSQNADTIDGFHARLTPAPNTLVPLNANGVLDLSATYVKSNVYTFRRVDLTNATSDYMLQVGEEAYISFNNTTSVPLRIGVESNTSLFLLFVYNRVRPSSSNGPVKLAPNNTVISSSFTRAVWELNSNGVTGSDTGSIDAFEICVWAPSNIFALCNIASRVVNFIYGRTGTDNVSRLGIGASVWTNTTTAWTSLGTIIFAENNSGYILVRRLA
jgi:hypothetical protein